MSCALFLSMNEGERYWLAALIDGEGSISITKGYGKAHWAGRAPKRGFIWGTKTHIFNTNKPLLDRAVVVVGGGNIILIHPPSKLRMNMKEGYDLIFNMDLSEKFLKEILPFLISKRRHAELFLEARELMKMYHGLGRTEDLTLVRDKRMEAIYWELRILNSRGRYGEREVEAEITALPEDPRLYTRERFDEEMNRTLKEREGRIMEGKLRRSREWKARNRERMAEYWAGYSARRRAQKEVE